MSECRLCRISSPCELLLLFGYALLHLGRWLGRMMTVEKPVQRPAGAYREIRLIDDRGELIAVERRPVGSLERSRDVPMMIEVQRETARV